MLNSIKGYIVRSSIRFIQDELERMESRLNEADGYSDKKFVHIHSNLSQDCNENNEAYEEESTPRAFENNVSGNVEERLQNLENTVKRLMNTIQMMDFGENNTNCNWKDDIYGRVDSIEKTLNTIGQQIDGLNKNDNTVVSPAPVSLYNITPEILGIHDDIPANANIIETTEPEIVEEVEEGAEEEEEEVEEEEVEEEVDEEVEEEEAEEEEIEEEEEVEEEVEEEEAEEEGIEEEEAEEVEEIEWKGQTYYKDTEGYIYRATGEGELEEEPIGVWNDKKQIVQFYKK
jgi:hypothetical protein